jgi:hypothetical protein
MRFFTLGRRIDPAYRTNRWVIVSFAVITIAGWILFGSFAGGAGLGAGFFLCWALAREIDPLHDISAFVSGGIFLSFFFLYDGLDFGVLFWLLLLLRMISGICGKKPTLVDILFLFGLTGYLAGSGRNSIYVVLLAAALAISYVRYGKDRKFLYAATVFGLILPFAVFGGWGFARGSIFGNLLWSSRLILPVFVVLAFGLLYFRKMDGLVPDDTGQPLDGKQVRLASLFFVIAVFCLAVFERITLMTFLNLLSAIAGVVIFAFLTNFQRTRA